MRIRANMQRIPGGMMLFPLLIGALIRTFLPDLFNLTEFRTSFTGGLLTGTSALLAAFYVCLGSTIQFKATGYILKKGVALWTGKIGTALIIALMIGWFAPNPNDLFLGLSALAIVAAFSDTNGGLYMALMGQLAKRREDVAAYSIMSVESGPFFTMLILALPVWRVFRYLRSFFRFCP
nr:2-keto-3-deoxygluconate permease [Cohnella kolymensis]